MPQLLQPHNQQLKIPVIRLIKKIMADEEDFVKEVKVIVTEVDEVDLEAVLLMSDKFHQGD